MCEGDEVNKSGVQQDEWLGGILGRAAFKVSVTRELMAESERLSFPTSPYFYYSKVAPTELAIVHYLEKSGFNLVDTNIQFDKTVNQEQPMAGNCKVRFACREDEQQAVALGGRAFQYSRFHLDQKIKKHVADVIKGEWVRNYFTGKRGDAMVIAEIDGCIVGFLQLLYQQSETLVIDLIAVDYNHRRKGIACDMIMFAETNCSRFSRILVGTQIANVPSMRMYEGLGFKVSSASYVFHCHG